MDTPGAAGAPDSLFPQPDSPGGRLLGRLVSLQVPGLPVEIALSALAQSVRLAPDVAASVLSRLAADGLVQLETETESEQLVVTVMLAPPLEDFGITPDWGEAVDQGPSPDGSPSDTQDGTPDNALSPDAQLAGGAPPVTPLHPDPPPAAAPAVAPRRSRTRRATPASAPPPPGPPAPPPPAPASVPTPAAPPGSAAKPKPGPLRQPAPASRASAGADETVQARNFVERFERLLSECETWRRRAQEAEERAKVAERRLATAERRAELAEGRLATAQERLRSWGELTRRMQQLARQADSVNRARPVRPEQPGRAKRPPSSEGA